MYIARIRDASLADCTPFTSHHHSISASFSLLLINLPQFIGLHNNCVTYLASRVSYPNPGTCAPGTARRTVPREYLASPRPPPRSGSLPACLSGEPHSPSQPQPRARRCSPHLATVQRQRSLSVSASGPCCLSACVCSWPLSLGTPTCRPVDLPPSWTSPPVTSPAAPRHHHQPITRDKPWQIAFLSDSHKLKPHRSDHQSEWEAWIEFMLGVPQRSSPLVSSPTPCPIRAGRHDLEVMDSDPFRHVEFFSMPTNQVRPLAVDRHVVLSLTLPRFSTPLTSPS